MTAAAGRRARTAGPAGIPATGVPVCLAAPMAPGADPRQPELLPYSFADVAAAAVITARLREHPDRSVESRTRELLSAVGLRRD